MTAPLCRCSPLMDVSPSTRPKTPRRPGPEALDSVLAGGFPSGRVFDPVQRGERVLYVMLSETEEELCSGAASHGWSLDGVTIPGAHTRRRRSYAGRAARPRAPVPNPPADRIRLVDDLMKVSRIARGKIEIRCEAIDLQAVLRAAGWTSQTLIENSRDWLTTDLPAHQSE